MRRAFHDVLSRFCVRRRDTRGTTWPVSVARVLVLCAAPLVLLGAAGTRGTPIAPPPLRVCANPNNLPFSNVLGEGFENRIAVVVAEELGRPLEFTWAAPGRGFVRRTLDAGACDVVIGVPSSVGVPSSAGAPSTIDVPPNAERVLTTRPYYRSTFVFVTRFDRRLRLGSLDDPALRRLRIGVPVDAGGGEDSPPAMALARRGLIANVRPFPVSRDDRRRNPEAAIIEAVVQRYVDAAIVWGPLAGYFGSRGAVPLRIAPLTPEIDPHGIPFAFDVSMGVRRIDRRLRDALDRALARRQATIRAILAEYRVPFAGGSAAEGDPPR